MESNDPLIKAMMAAQQRQADPLQELSALSSFGPTGQQAPFQYAQPNQQAWQQMPRAPIEDRRNEVMFPAPQESYGPQGSIGMAVPGMLDETPLPPSGRFNRQMIRDHVTDNQLRYMDRTGHDGGNAYVDTPEMARRWGR